MPSIERCPAVAHDARLLDGAAACRIETFDEAFEIAGPGDPAAVHRALSEMYGDTPVPALAAASGLAPDDLSAICDALARHGVLAYAGPADDESAPVDRDAFVAACTERFSAWKQRVFSAPLWTALADGTASRPLFLGWLIENYHLIEAATIRLPVAIAACAEPAVKRHFMKHFREEYDHHHFFRESLRAAGLDVAAVAASRPLPGTAAVVHHMRACARRDSLSYAACSGFLESTGEDHRRSREFFARIGAHFDAADGRIVTPLADHAALDEGYGHCGMLGLVARATATITRGRARRALADAYALVETLELWSADILRHYDGDAAVARAARRYRPVAAAETAQ